MDGSWIIPVRDGTVTRVSFDYAQITLFCEPLALTIEGEITITNQSGGKAVVDPDPSNDPHLLSPILKVLRDTIQEVVATKDGMLIVRFASGTRIEVPADTKYEAWHVNELSGIDGFRVVSMPGGELAIWQGVELSSRNPACKYHTILR